MVGRSMITSSIAFIIYIPVMFLAYILTIWFGQLPFLVFASQFTLGFIAYISKRLIARKKDYNGKA